MRPASPYRPFEQMRRARAFARQNMKFVRTLEDVDLLLEIGFHQEQGRRLTVKQLYRANIASMATLQRRLQRLRRAGVLVERRSQEDGRSIELALAPQVFKLWEKYGELQSNSFAGLEMTGADAHR